LYEKRIQITFLKIFAFVIATGLDPGQLSQAKAMWVHLHAAGIEILGKTATIQKGEEKLQ
jgi:hypothetical protein